MSEPSNALKLFHPAVASWFQKTLGEPTLPQEMGWPHIHAGRNCLILAPTGSGKTLAAFLAGIDRLIRESLNGSSHKGVSILYISPLKALNYDIEKNLRIPLEGIKRELASLDVQVPEIKIGVRTGDTPSNERVKMARKPPHILITTPESLNLILCSRASSMLKSVRQVIVDEVHSLAPNKRGAFLSVLLERMENITEGSPIRTGLSATQRPLEETARFLGGYLDDGSARPVQIVDASTRKGLDVTVTTAVPDLRSLQSGELWPSLERKILKQIESHKSTIVFASNRRTVERLTLSLNEQAGERLVEPHHGSISAPRRKETEQRLKSGDLRGVIATSSLELGIDMGAVDLVCQVQSPKTVSSGLQRVGRAGHLHNVTSKGMIFTSSMPDLLETVVIGRNMLEGKVEAIKAERNPLDVLAQQVVAMTVHGPIKTGEILSTMRRSACFNSLPEEAFWRTVEMVSGRLGRDFKPRVSLDRMNSVLSPLPGTLRSVISSGGVIPNTGQFPVYLTGTRLSIGELDEEFVWEAREGEAFRLGTSIWRIEKIEADRIFVHPAPGSLAKMPFWRGELVARPADLGEDIGEFLYKCEQIDDENDLVHWIEENSPADREAAQNVAGFVLQQKQQSALPTNKRIVVEHFLDALGEGRLAVISPFGSRVHQALRIALVELFRQEMGVIPESAADDGGVLVRLPDDVEDPTELVRKLTRERFARLLEDGLLNSPLFGLRFRQNAARALLLPGSSPGKRNPLWLQRLKAKDLLQVCREIPDFPIIAETIRECRTRILDVEKTLEILGGIERGEVEVSVSTSKSPSPFASWLEFMFKSEFMYVWDRPIQQGVSGAQAGMAEVIETGERGIDPQAIERLLEDAQHLPEHRRARTAAEFVEMMRELGPLSASEAARRSSTQDISLLDEAMVSGQISSLTMGGNERFVLTEEVKQWIQALEFPEQHEGFWRQVAAQYILTNPGCQPENFASRYGLTMGLARRAFDEMLAREQCVLVNGEWLSRDLMEAARRITLAIRRQEAQPVSVEAFQNFVFRWQHCHNKLQGQDGLGEILEQLTGFAAPADIWESELLSRRLEHYTSEWLDSALATGGMVWRSVPGSGRPANIRFFPRGLAESVPEREGKPVSLTPLGGAILEALENRGASFVIDIALALKEDSRRVEKELLSLAWAGVVTQDGFGAVRMGESKPSVKEAAMKTHGSPRQRYQQLKRLKPSISPAASARWSLAPGAKAEMDEISEEIIVRLLLERYGVLSRDIWQRESFGPGWAAAYRILERMELSGEIERGWYIRDMGGAQFVLPEAARRLREGVTDSTDLLILNACDPSIVTDGEWARRSTNWVIFRGGKAVVMVEAGSQRLTPLTDEADALQGLKAIGNLFGKHTPHKKLKHLEVRYWGDREISDSPMEAELRSVGFNRTPNGLVLEPARSFAVD